MAMTKKERAEFDAAINRAELLAALRWTARVLPDVDPPPTMSREITSGWTFNSYSKRVTEGWSSSIYHGSGTKPDSRSSGSQQPQKLYSTRCLALMALRHEVEREVAHDLLKIDREIAKEITA